MKRRKIIPKILLLLLFSSFFINNNISQEVEPLPNEYKHCIKAWVFVFPVFSAFTFSSSLGYEMRFNSNHSIELVGSYFYFEDEMGTTTELLGIMPGYNYYFRKENQKGPEFRLGGYLSFKNDIPDHWGTGSYRYGVGILAGLRVNISKSRKCSLDLAIGNTLSYQEEYDVYIMRDDSPWNFTLRPVVHFVRKF